MSSSDWRRLPEVVVLSLLVDAREDVVAEEEEDVEEAREFDELESLKVISKSFWKLMCSLRWFLKELNI